MRDRSGHALAAVAPLVAVPQFDGLELTGRRAGRNGGAPGGATSERNLDLNRRVAPTIQDFLTDYTRDELVVIHSLSPTRADGLTIVEKDRSGLDRAMAKTTSVAWIRR